MSRMQTINLYHVKEQGWEFIANYDVTQLHYEGPGNVPGASGTPYGWAPRTQGKTSTVEITNSTHQGAAQADEQPLTAQAQPQQS